MEEKSNLSKESDKQKKQRLIVRISIAAVIVLALVLIIVNWQTIFSPFRDMFLPVGKGGYPVQLSGSTAYQMGELNDNYYILTDTYLYTYNPEGAEIMGAQHGFNKPVASSGGKRVIVYDKNGKDYKVFSKSAETFSGTMEDPIVFSEMGPTERSAVVTTSTRYANYLYIFSAEGKQIFRWASPEEKIMRVCFSDNGNCIFVSVVGEKDGELRCAVLCFDITKEQGEMWRASTGTGIVLSLECCPDGIYAVTEQDAWIFDEKTGETKAKTVFTRPLTGVCTFGKMRVALFSDTTSNGIIAASYDENLSETGLLSIPEADAFACDGKMFFVLSGDRLAAYDSKLLAKRNYRLDDDYSGLMIMNNAAYLLGYNTLSRVRL